MMIIPPDDRGFTLGDGLFETVLAEGGRLRRLKAHLARLTSGCARLGLPAPAAEEAEALMREALVGARLENARAAVRLTLTAGSGGRGLDRPAVPTPRMVATAAPAPRPTTPARLVTASIPRNERSPASGLKTLAYVDNVLARREAQANGGDEALMLNTRGEIACAAAANLFWMEDGELVTPALDCGALAGTMRAAVIAAAPGAGLSIREAAARPEALARAEAVFLTNALIGVREVVSLDGRELRASPSVARLAAVAAQ
jgi:branched-chain amino acid aminotransferase/4-amino-4-deoxychorismate lyase